MHHLRGRGARAARKIAAFDQRHAQPAPRGVTRDAGAGYTAANDDHVEDCPDKVLELSTQHARGSGVRMAKDGFADGHCS